MTLKHRIMVVDSLCTCLHNDTQNLDLILLNRKASANFYNKFPNKTSADTARILEYARENEINCLSRPGSSFSHKKHHQVRLVKKYHLGDIITEQAAYNFGYVEPHIDTIACKIVDSADAFTEGFKKKLTETLREKSVITPNYTVIITPDIYGRRIHVLDNKLVENYRHVNSDELNHLQINISHPIDLLVFPAREDNLIPVGVMGFYVEQKGTVFEFMTYVPIK